MATPRQHVVHADRKDGAIDQNAKPYATVTESADERWNRKKENVKSKWIFISFIPIKPMYSVYCQAYKVKEYVALLNWSVLAIG